MKYITLALALLLALPTYSMAENISLFRGQGADTNLLEVIPDIVKGDLRMDPTLFLGINYSDTIQNRGINWFARLLLRNNISTEWESQITKHTGLQNNYEAHLSILLRTQNFQPDPLTSIMQRELAPPTPLASRPTKMGPDGKPNNEKHKFESFMIVEIELSLQSLPQRKVLIRIHHRSGIYGLVALPKVGSNFLAI